MLRTTPSSNLSRRQSLTGLLWLAGCGRAAPPAPLGPGNLPPQWQFDVDLSDEFEGGQLEAQRWFDHDPLWEGRPPSRFDRRNVSHRRGLLRLLSTAQPEGSPSRYHTAAIKARQPMRYGYLETRARAGASAISSAFWLYAKDEDRWTEIDVFELSGAPAQRTTLHTAAHVFYDHPRGLRDPLHLQRPIALDFPVHEDFHVYGLAWSPERLEWWVDGRVVRALPNEHWHQPLHLMFDSEVFEDWFGLPDAAALPARYDIDYLRVWRAPGGHA
ncbi:family 16 glycosylhydrolase [Ramlibacter sp.]|uniref:family 16 glycosylhydrolase n=1 Tax=Ramlibacter sp. TaxID=1917967 RepID=UPI002FCCA992